VLDFDRQPAVKAEKPQAKVTA